MHHHIHTLTNAISWLPVILLHETETWHQSCSWGLSCLDGQREMYFITSCLSNVYILFNGILNKLQYSNRRCRYKTDHNGKVVTLLTCFQKVSALNFDWVTGYPKWGFMLFSSGSPDKSYNSMGYSICDQWRRFKPNRRYLVWFSARSVTILWFFIVVLCPFR